MVKMENLFKQYGYNLSEKQYRQFKNYCDILREYNAKFNLTAITDEKEIYIKHFIDSLSGKDFILGEKIADIGSGGGFPALPLKIIFPDINLTMIEATGKKCGFLKDAVKFLELDKTIVINARAEDFGKNKDFRENFDTVTARAVAKLNILSELCLPFVKKGGVFIAYKGKADEEIVRAENAVKTLGGKIKEVKKFSLNGDDRTVIVIEKTNETPAEFPRANAKIKKKPL